MAGKYNPKKHADTTRAHQMISDDSGTVVHAVPTEDLTDLEQIERENGFVFGLPTDHDTAGAHEIASVQCTTPGCPMSHTAVTIHADTEQPVRCGGCHAVLYCDHEPKTETITGGTIGAPTRTVREVCEKCATVLSEEVEQLPPIDLNSLPASILDTPIQ